ncbi:MAG: hypothetical protein ACJAS9_000868 [Polaribacter sp.]|jgi:hypothetical protein
MYNIKHDVKTRRIRPLCRLFTMLVVVATLYACSNSSNTDEEVPEEVPEIVIASGIASKWNEEMLTAIRAGSPRPTVLTRQMFIVSVAMYDAWAAYDAIATPYALPTSNRRPDAEHTLANQEAAVSHAAYHALTSIYAPFNTDTGAFDDFLTSLGLTASTNADGDTPASIGFLAAQAALADRADDLSNADNNFGDITSAYYPALYESINSADPTSSFAIGGVDFDPNRWSPIRVPNGTFQDANGFPAVDNNDPSTFSDQTFLTPHWGAVTPFALTSPDQFRPPAPPQNGSNASYTDGEGETMTNDEAWNKQVAEVLSFSANLSDREKVIAEFWADGPRSESPPGHWNQLSHGVSSRDGLTVGDEVKMYFALNAALMDAGIATWEAKREYDYIRPVSAIQSDYNGVTVAAWGGPDLGTLAIDGNTWRPYQDPTFVTPPFAEFTSGHSGFSRAAAEVLTAFTGSSQFYDATSLAGGDFDGDGEQDMLGQHIQLPATNMFESSPMLSVTLRWNTFYDAADEAGRSRLFGGIHIKDGDLRGREIGEAVGTQAYGLAEQYWNGTIVR